MRSFFICLYLLCLLSLSLYGQTCLAPPTIPPCLLSAACPNPVPAGEPNVWNGGESWDCAERISRYLARAVQMDGLSSLIYNNGNCNGAQTCEPPYNTCWEHYCPDKYCEQIKYLTKINAQFIVRGYEAGAYKENQFYEGQKEYCLGRQLITDINYAYDCAGLRRPIVQAVIAEFGTFSSFHHPNQPCDGSLGLNFDCANDNVDRHIPGWVIKMYDKYFPGDMDARDPQSNQTFRAYYFFPDGTPRNNRYFEHDRIADKPGGSIFEINKLEMRMWFFYQAMSVINFGFKAIHMGIYWQYAYHDRPMYRQLYRLTNAIRRYAKEEKNTFVLLSGETPMEDVDGGQSATYNQSDQLIFDFDSRAMRPREIAPGIGGDGNIEKMQQGCNQAIPASVLDAITHSPCAGGKFNAVVDPCSIESFGGSDGPYRSPAGCYYDKVPYMVHWDGGSGISHTGSGCGDFCFKGCGHDFVPAGQASKGPSSLTWGFDDSRWFGQQFSFDNEDKPFPDPLLSNECRRWWFHYFYCERRRYHDGNGFIMLPGMLYVRYVERYCLDENHLNKAGGLYLMSEDQDFVDTINDSTLAPQKPEIILTEGCGKYHCAEAYNGVPAPDQYLWKVAKRFYTLDVGNRDCSSVYTFHIKNMAGGAWWTPVYNGPYYFLPPSAGDYEITIRQNNLGLVVDGSDGSDGFGARAVSGVFHLDSASYCCQGAVPVSACTDSGSVQLSLISPALEVSPNPATTILNLRYTVSLSGEVDILVYDALGRLRISNKSNVLPGVNHEFVLTENLPSGQYWVRIKGDSGTVCRRFIKK